MRLGWRGFLMFLIAASHAHASSWKTNEDGDVSLTIGAQNLVVTCEAVTYQPSLIHIPRVYYTPSCPDDCFISDPTRLATVFLDDSPYPADLWGSDQPEFYVKSQTLDMFLKQLPKAQHIAIYSAQVTPHYVDFGAVGNQSALDAFYAQCRARDQLDAALP